MKFFVDDIESEWAEENNPFDFIHARYLTGSIRDFERLIEQCYRYAMVITLLDSPNQNRSVKPGGWVEFQDWDVYPNSPDGSVDGTWFRQYYDEVSGAFEEAGYDVRPGIKLEQWFKDAGFVNIHVEKFIVPHGVWPKDRHLVSIPLCLQVANQIMRYILIFLYRRKSAPGCKLRQKPASRAEPWPL